MADSIRSVQYVYVVVKDRPGEGATILAALKRARVNLLAFSGFPLGGRGAQVDLVTDDMTALRRVAKAHGWKLSPPKKGLLVWGSDRVGAVANILGKLAAAKINVTAADAVAAGKGRYGMILWVKPAAQAKAAKLLGAKK